MFVAFSLLVVVLWVVIFVEGECRDWSGGCLGEKVEAQEDAWLECCAASSGEGVSLVIDEEGGLRFLLVGEGNADEFDGVFLAFHGLRFCFASCEGVNDACAILFAGGGVFSFFTQVVAATGCEGRVFALLPEDVVGIARARVKVAAKRAVRARVFSLFADAVAEAGCLKGVGAREVG